MKTLKQIREEYDSRFVPQVDNLPEELMFEERMKNSLPSYAQMPTLLVFRRVSYRSYPKGQVVALYYSKIVDKYLSIPFGPDGNLNLSEARVVEDWKETISDIGKSMPGYEDKEASKAAWKKGDYLGAAGHQAKALGKAAATGAAVSIGGYALARGGLGLASRAARGGGVGSAIKSGLKGLGKFAKSAADKAIEANKQKEADLSHTTTAPSHLDQAHAKVSSTWKPKVTNENKIADIRQMVLEGVDTKSLSINGRQVTLNTTMAKRILEVYDSVNTKNKKIVESMLNEDLESFKKLLNFSIKA
jgi:hypothetical protein